MLWMVEDGVHGADVIRRRVPPPTQFRPCSFTPSHLHAIMHRLLWHVLVLQPARQA